MEGGNLSLDGHEAEQINLLVHKRSFMVPLLNTLLLSIDKAYRQHAGSNLWEPTLLKNRTFLSGSSLHFFNDVNISDETFTKVKPKVGDIDTMVDKEKETTLAAFLNDVKGKQVGPAIFIGYQRGNEQYSSLWRFEDLPITIQIDFEFVSFDQGLPTEWSRFSHSSSWDDMQNSIKGVFHKFLIQSLASLTKREFLLRKMVGKGKKRKEEDVPTVDNMFSFAVSSKEGGGLRIKYVPVMDGNTPLVKDGLPVMSAAPAAGYEQNVGKIFLSLFGKRLSPASLKKVSNKLWSFVGLLEIMSSVLSQEEKETVFRTFLEKTVGPGAQGIYKNDPDRDITEKTVAINKAMEVLGLEKPSDLLPMIKQYKDNYKMTPTESLREATIKPNFKRKGVQHIYNPGSSTEIQDLDFIAFCKEIAENGGTLDNVQINLKADGAGIRFGKDESGKPFFMTSRVTEPKYIENYGDFEKYGISVGQDAERLEFTKNYDKALKIILTSDLVKSLPSDTIVQAEMMFNAMAQKSDGGYKFVNITYDPKKLGKVMTLVPIFIKSFSTGEDRPDGMEIKKKLLSLSSPNIKVVNNALKQKGVQLGPIVDKVLENENEITATLKTKGLTPEKEQVRKFLSSAKKQVSDAIINSPAIKGKDQLGKVIEGLVINMPSGMVLKVTSQEMKDIMAAKKATPVSSGPRSNKTAVVAVGSAIGHVGHQQLFKYAIDKANEVGGEPFMFIGPAEGKDDPIPPSVKVQTWQKLYPQYANNISTVTQEGGNLLQKIKHELINPRPGQPPRFDNVIITVGTDRESMAANWSKSLMRAVNKFAGYEHVKAMPYVTPRESEKGGTGVSGTYLRNILKDPNASPEQQFAAWQKAYNSGDFGAKKLDSEWIKQLMDIAKKNMGLSEMKASRKTESVVTPASNPYGADSQAPKFGRSSTFLESKKKFTDQKVWVSAVKVLEGKISHVKSGKYEALNENGIRIGAWDSNRDLGWLTEMTSASSVAPMAFPIGVTHSRTKGKGSIFGGIRTSKKFVNEDDETRADEIYTAFEQSYPNLARKAGDRVIQAAITSVLNYGEGDPTALAQDVARAVRKSLTNMSEGLTLKESEVAEAKKIKQRLDPKCWKGYRKSGTKIKGGVRVNNCVKKKKSSSKSVSEAALDEEQILAKKLGRDFIDYKEAKDRELGNRPKDREVQSKLNEKTLGGFQVKPITKVVDEAIGLNAPHRRLGHEEIYGYVDRTMKGTKSKKEKVTGPIIHASNVKITKSDDGEDVWDLEDLANKITKRPSSILGTNAKMKKSAKEGEIIYDLTLPALKGLVIDEETGEFVEITTCPKAGECQLFCYARKGGYIMFPNSSMSAAQALNFLVNDPEGYMNMVNQEIHDIKKKMDKKGIKLVVRWHDAGDFFSKEYLNMAYEVAKKNPAVEFYAYTKIADVATDDKPDNFIINFSSGSKSSEVKKIEFHKKQGNVVKQGITVPKSMFFDLIAREGTKLIKDEQGRTQFKNQEALDLFKQRLADKYDVDVNTIISYDEMLSIPPSNVPKWNVIVQPGAGDRAANRKDVIDSYLMFH
jgi:hypothetical protein